MMKKSFSGMTRPRFEYESLTGTPAEPEKIPVPKTATLFFKVPYARTKPVSFKIGDKVKTGQKLLLYEGEDAYVISSVTGTVSGIAPYAGDFGQSWTSVSIDAADTEETDETFAGIGNSLTLQDAADHLAFLPGNPPLKTLSDPARPVHTIVVCGMDKDLLMTANQYAVMKYTEDITAGISILKKISEADHVIVALPRNLTSVAGGIGGASGVEVRVIDSAYPSALPPMIARDVIGKVIPAGKSMEEMGMAFFTAEAVASFGKAVRTGKIPVTKTLTVIRKDLSRILVSARIGTPICEILNIADVTLNEKDRIIIGGPMTGSAVFSEYQPVCPDTDAVMVQDAGEVSLSSDFPCINCGECVRICPARVQVNMLVRFCEAGQYEAGADMYDLYSCIECGLCSFVCVAKIPVFQYIRLAKHELERMNAAEETDV